MKKEIPGAAMNKTYRADRLELINQVLHGTFRLVLMKTRPTFVGNLDSSLG